MSDINDLVKALDQGRIIYESLMNQDEVIDFSADEIYSSHSGDDKEINRIAAGDNLRYMIYLLKSCNMSGKLQLIYVDPPFFSKGKYQASVRIVSDKLGESELIKTGAYDDWSDSGLCDYLTMLAACFTAMKELLAETGSICVHIDWHVSHYIRLMLDHIFGEKNFINEIIWTYKSGGSGKRSFAKKHDTLFLYGRTDGYVFNQLKEKSYNRGFKPYRFKGVEEFCDETGWYTMVNMKDVWNIDMVGRTSSERTGYATQKPEKLVERIIGSCSNEGDICADFFAGSGTFGAVCERMGRRWIMCDMGDVAISSQIMRIAGEGGSFCVQRENNGEIEGGLNCLLTDDELELSEYETDEDRLFCSNKEEVMKYVRDDGLSLIKFWSADFEHDGRVHRADRIYPGNIRRIPYDTHGKKGFINVTAYDVFGKCVKCQLKNDG